MDVDFNVANVLKRIEDSDLMTNFPIKSEEARNNFLCKWMKLYREDLTKLLSLEDHTNDEIEAEISSLNSMVDGRMVTIANARKERPRDCIRALKDKCKAEEDYYNRLIIEGEKFAMGDAGSIETIKSGPDDFELETKKEIEYMKSMVASCKSLGSTLEIGSSVMQLSQELEKAKSLHLFEETELEKKIFHDKFDT